MLAVTNLVSPNQKSSVPLLVANTVCPFCDMQKSDLSAGRLQVTLGLAGHDPVVTSGGQTPSLAHGLDRTTAFYFDMSSCQ